MGDILSLEKILIEYPTIIFLHTINLFLSFLSQNLNHPSQNPVKSLFL